LLAEAGKMYEFAVGGRRATREPTQIRRERGADVSRLMGIPE